MENWCHTPHIQLERKSTNMRALMLNYKCSLSGLMMGSVCLLSIAIHVGMILVSQFEATPAEVISTENSDGYCRCHTELNLTVPPCVCTGMTEALEEVIRLKTEIRELRDKYSTVNTTVIYACKYIYILQCVYILIYLKLNSLSSYFDHRQSASLDNRWCSLD